MRIVLIQPPIEDFYETDIRLQPIGLCYLKSAIKKYLPHWEVIVKDYHQGWGRQTVAWPRELMYLKEFYTHPDKSPFSSFYHYYHFGREFEEIGVEVSNLKPDVVGISSLFTPYHREVLKTAEAIKQRIPVPILVGGSHVSADPRMALGDKSVDFVISGEGERAIVEFLKAFEGGQNYEGVPQLGFKRGDQFIFNPTAENYAIEELPFPDLSDFSHSDYFFEGRPMTFMVTSRSCPHRCTFCSVHLTFGHRYRRRTVEDIMAEIVQRHREGYRVIDFEDDNLTFFKDEMKDLCRRLITLFPRGEMEFLAMNGISYLSLDEELLELMKAAGFSHLNLALVSSDKSVRETTKRPHTMEAYLKVVNKSFELGFKIVSYQILGLPQEPLDSMVQTLCFNSRLPVLLGASLFYLTPNSPMAKQFPPLSEEDYFRSRLTAMAWESAEFAREDLYTLFITTRIINFLKGLPLAEDTEIFSVLNSSAFFDGPLGSREKLGLDLLRSLWQTGALYMCSGGARHLNRRFKKSLFDRVIEQCAELRTLGGIRLDLRSGLEASWPQKRGSSARPRSEITF